MEKKTSPAITIIFYIIGIIFLIISAFMLVTAISYTKTYLQSYDASFADMWSHSLQYIITQCGPYMGFGIMALGIGRAIKEARSAQSGVGVALGSAKADSAKATDSAASNSDLSDKVAYLAEQIEATREVIGIRIEEKEKRDSFRLKELGDKLVAAGIIPAEEVTPEGVAAAETPVALDEELIGEEPAVHDENEEYAGEPGPVPEITRQVEEMAMPSIPNVDNSKTDTITLFDKNSNENSEIETSEPGFVPEIMRQVGMMAMPEIPTVVEKVAVADDSDERGKNTETISFDPFAYRDTKRDTFSKSELKKALAREEALRELDEEAKEAKAEDAKEAEAEATKETKKKTKKKTKQEK